MSTWQVDIVGVG